MASPRANTDELIRLKRLEEEVRRLRLSMWDEQSCGCDGGGGAIMGYLHARSPQNGLVAGDVSVGFYPEWEVTDSSGPLSLGINTGFGFDLHQIETAADGTFLAKWTAAIALSHEPGGVGLDTGAVVTWSVLASGATAPNDTWDQEQDSDWIHFRRILNGTGALAVATPLRTVVSSDDTDGTHVTYEGRSYLDVYQLA